MSSHRTARAGFVAAVVAGLTLGLSPITPQVAPVLPVASAATPNVVVVGDSLPANPTIADYFASKTPSEISQALSSTARLTETGCGSDFYFVNVYNAVSGKPTVNFTCPGASFFTGGQHIWDQLQRAADAGQLGPDTSEVVIFAGANDFWPRLAQGENMADIESSSRQSLIDAVNHARHLAPHARVKIVGTPSISNSEGGVCLLNIIPGLPMGIPAAIVTQAEDALQRAQTAAAQETGAVYINSRALSAGHDTCSNDRWIAGIMDTTVQSPQTLMLHMTQHAIEELASATVRS